MCQQGQAEIYHSQHEEKEAIFQRWESFQRGDIELTRDELDAMAVRMLMLREAIG